MKCYSTAGMGAQEGNVRELLGLLSGRDDSMALDEAALWLARIEHPDLNFSPYLELLDSHASELEGRLKPGAGGAEFVTAANAYLFEELGFAGNSEDYYRPGNSCLNDVLVERTGIPITLSLVYMEIARRLGRPVVGIGLPGHFVIKYDDGAFTTFIDPFYRGRLLSTRDCCQIAREVARVDVKPDSNTLTALPKRHMLLRMCHNLLAVYLLRRNFPKAMEITNLLLEADPRSPDGYKQRGLLHLQMDNPRAARADLERYLELVPAAEDYPEISRQVVSLKQYLAGLN